MLALLLRNSIPTSLTPSLMTRLEFSLQRSRRLSYCTVKPTTLFLRRRTSWKDK
jgi:hypothetical protein